jgi:stearoyl-CoA desaturase (delta-9 desaturase)
MHQRMPVLLHAALYLQGFWWSHIGWLFSTEASMLDYTNAPDLKAQLFYRIMEVTFFPWLFVIKPYLTYQYGGMEMVCWSIAVPMVAGWHSTFLVNSAAHTYGRQPYDTGEWSYLQREG